MIISASRRTDIPTYYSEWFANRVREGFLYVRNPMYIHQVSKISLSPDVVDCIVFWTKNPIPMLKRLDDFSAYPYYFQFTLTGYGHDIEATLPDKNEKLVPAFRQLSSEIGPQKVIWRYDPIVFNAKYTPEYHLRAFGKIATALDGCTEKSVISFVDVYKRNKRRIDELSPYELSDNQLLEFAARLHDIAAEHGMVVATCAEKIDLSQVGIIHNACIDKDLIERITACPMKVSKDKTQRPECGCVASIDIGSYNTCRNGCLYCYANFNPSTVGENAAKYDVGSPILCDVLREDDKISERPMKSLLQRQMRL